MAQTMKEKLVEVISDECDCENIAAERALKRIHAILREPTEAMLQAGFDLPGLPIEPRETRMDEMMDRGDWIERAPRSFTAMIDAALAEE